MRPNKNVQKKLFTEEISTRAALKFWGNETGAERTRFFFLGGGGILDKKHRENVGRVRNGTQ